MEQVETVRLEGKINLIDSKLDNLSKSFEEFKSGLLKLHEDRGKEILSIRTDVDELKNFKFKLIGIGIVILFCSSIIVSGVVYVIKHT